MYYAPRRAPKKPGMPLLGYFAVVGAVLTALLFAANAFMDKPDKLSFANNFYGLPAEYRGEPGTRRPEPRPEIASTTPAAETTGAAPAAQHVAAASKPAPHVAKPAKQPPRKIVHRWPRRQEQDDWFGNNNRREFASGSRDPFASSFRDREPSWRDSWASGAFDQPRDRSSRRAYRQSNDFWFR